MDLVAKLSKLLPAGCKVNLDQHGCKVKTPWGKTVQFTNPELVAAGSMCALVMERVHASQDEYFDRGVD